MKGMFYFILLILTVIFPNEIGASSEKSFDTHLRKKRIIDNSSSRIVINSIYQVPYIVQLLKNMQRGYCAGTILSPIDIISAGHCFKLPGTYQVVSNSIMVGQGIVHNVIHIRIHEQYNPDSRKNDLALLKISPAIDFVHSGNRPIPLHNERYPITSIPVTSGWGCTGISPTTYQPVFPQELQSMAVPIINKTLCINLYHEEAANIDDKLICTRDPLGLKTSCPGDSGNPLVTNNHLIGIMIWSDIHPHPHFPDFFLKVYHHTYVQWINEHMHQRA